MKHFHKIVVNIETMKFTIKIHPLGCFFTYSFHLKLEDQLFIKDTCQDICTAAQTQQPDRYLTQGEMTVRFFLKYIV